MAGKDGQAIGGDLGGGVIGKAPDQAAGLPGDPARCGASREAAGARVGEGYGVQIRQRGLGLVGMLLLVGAMLCPNRDVAETLAL